MRANFLSRRVWNSYGIIVDACCDAWNKLMNMPQRLASITRRTWARAVNGKGVWYQNDMDRLTPCGAERIAGITWNHIGLALAENMLGCRVHRFNLTVLLLCC